MTDYEMVKNNVANQITAVRAQQSNNTTSKQDDTTLMNEIGLAINREGGMSI